MTDSADSVVTPHPAGQRPWAGRFTADELTNDAYHAAPGVSKSHLDIIADQSPLHYWESYLNPTRPVRRATDALRVGNAVHSAILQPDLFTSHYVDVPPCDMRTKIGKETYDNFLRHHKKGREELSAKEYKMCVEMRDAVHAHKIAAGLLRGGKAEHSFFCNERETGQLIKCRADYFHDDGDLVVDLKSTVDSNPDSFGKDATNYRYDVAVPWYLDIIQSVTGHAPRNWVFIAVEKERPYAVGIYYAQKHDIIRARDTARRNFLQILEYRKLNEWPDYGDRVRPLELKPWAKR